MSDSTADISVIIPCYNAQRTLGEALESVFTQTAPPLEVLLIDDNSRDRSVSVARSFGSRVRVMTNPRGGQGAARYVGVREAVGKYIAFIDADDRIEPTKHEKQLEVLEHADRHTVVHTGSMIFWDDGSRPNYQRTGAESAVGSCTQTIFERNPVCGASTMLHRSVILELGNYDPDLIGTEDFGMSLLASTRCNFVHLPEPLYWMRRHNTNITHRLAHMAYMHWLAQEKFRLKCPHAFEALPDETVRQFMIEPVLRHLKEAYWRRDGRDYPRLLKLARRLAPADPDIDKLWQRRRIPMQLLRFYDRFNNKRRPKLRKAC
jgi:glycosyltransferase involved in cell wall biosynthesis